MDQRNCEVLTTDIEWPHMRVFIYAYLLWITVWSFDFELRGKNDNGFNPPPPNFDESNNVWHSSILLCCDNEDFERFWNTKIFSFNSKMQIEAYH